MGYWGYHPLDGDQPMDFKGEVFDFLVSCLVADIKAEQAIGEVNSNITDELREFKNNYLNEENLVNYDDVDEDELYRVTDELWKIYKYEIIHRYINDDDDNYYSFVIPFTFISLGLKVKEPYVKYLVDLLGDGGANDRDYDEWNGIDKEHPYYYVNIVKENPDIFFNEECDENILQQYLDEHLDLYEDASNTSSLMFNL